MEADTVQLIIVTLCLMGLFVVAMAVGVIIRNRGFTSCACGSIEYKGEKIRCPACPEGDDEVPAEEQKA